MTAYVDAKGAVRAWVNAQTADLVGVGHPLVKGAFIKRPGTVSFSVTWCQLVLVGGGQAGPAETPQHRARVSATFYGPSQEDADLAAVAYANKLGTLRGVPVAMDADTICLYVDQGTISGPLEVPQRSGSAAAVVDADFYLRAA